MCGRVCGMHYYTERYHRAMEALNVETPSIEPHASGHIIEQIAFVQRILDEGFAYVSNGVAVDRGAAHIHARTPRYQRLECFLAPRGPTFEKIH